MKNKKPIVIYVDEDLFNRVDETCKRIGRSRTATSEILLQVGLLGMKVPLDVLQRN